MNVVHAYFGIPYGAVWSNLLASLICVGFAWWRLRARMIAHHAQALAQAAAHHKEKLAQADAHHQELKTQLAAHCADIKQHVSAQAPKRGAR